MVTTGAQSSRAADEGRRKDSAEVSSWRELKCSRIIRGPIVDRCLVW